MDLIPNTQHRRQKLTALLLLSPLPPLRLHHRRSRRQGRGRQRQLHQLGEGGARLGRAGEENDGLALGVGEGVELEAKGDVVGRAVGEAMDGGAVCLCVWVMCVFVRGLEDCV